MQQHRVGEEKYPSRLKFITSPNGYGKTTILHLIHALLNGDNKKLFSIPFGSFVIFLKMTVY